MSRFVRVALRVVNKKRRCDSDVPDDLVPGGIFLKPTEHVFARLKSVIGNVEWITSWQGQALAVTGAAATEIGESKTCQVFDSKAKLIST